MTLKGNDLTLKMCRVEHGVSWSVEGEFVRLVISIELKAVTFKIKKIGVALIQLFL